jgi:squalene-hopene/tetraprenyl-beta-curcumene cyclase
MCSVKTTRVFAIVFISSFLATAGHAASDSSVDTAASASTTWSAADAARYLDGRQIWWQGWKVSQRDHSTVCVSCHTVLPYALSRSSLRGSLGEQDLSGPERVMLNNVLRRVKLWNEVGPFYYTGIDGPLKTPESRGTESVLNALVLAIYNPQKNQMTEIERSAFDNAWELQLKSGPQAGAWDWLNFKLAPWESNESQYYGATLAAIAVGKAPANYCVDPKIQGNLQLLRGYLRREYADQPLLNKVYLLWASGKLPGLLTDSERSALLTTILSKQRPDGGWSLSDLGAWQRKDGTALETKSDGYATGLTVLALEESGFAQNLPQAKRGLAWLEQNQLQGEGKWPAWSLNLKRDSASYVGHFMNDAATGFAVLAIENSH